MYFTLISSHGQTEKVSLSDTLWDGLKIKVNVQAKQILSEDYKHEYASGDSANLMWTNHSWTNHHEKLRSQLSCTSNVRFESVIEKHDGF